MNSVKDNWIWKLVEENNPNICYTMGNRQILLFKYTEDTCVSIAEETACSVRFKLYERNILCGIRWQIA